MRFRYRKGDQDALIVLAYGPEARADSSVVAETNSCTNAAGKAKAEGSEPGLLKRCG